MKKGMLRKLLSMSIVLAMVMSLFGCGAKTSPSRSIEAPAGDAAKEQAPADQAPADQAAADQTTAADQAPAAKVSADDIDLKELIASMTTEEKIAQLMIVSLRSDAVNTDTVKELDENYAKLLKKYDFGGIILFFGNIQDAAQTVKLIRDSQAATLQSAHAIPMFVCVDQEGGRVNRVGFGTTGSGNMALAATGSTALTEESARILGEEIKALGFNVDYAPVADVNSNPANPIIGVRAFSDDPQIVAEHVTAYIKGLDEAGSIAVIKHFPGHGDVGEDSHTHLPCSSLTLDDMMSCELIPFQAGIDSGADMIMTAHIQYPEIEQGTYVSIKDGVEVNLPATLSRTIITGLLREKMGYDGIVVTDAMDMGAIVEHFDPVDAAVMAINADVDILLCSANIYKDKNIDTFSVVENYIADIAARVESGEIAQEELDNSVLRVLALKKEKGILKYNGQDPLEDQIAKAEALVGSASNHTREWEIAQAGMTLLKNEGHALPLGKEESALILYPNEARYPSVEYASARLAKEGLADSSKVTAMCFENLAADDAALAAALDQNEKLVILSQATTWSEAVANAIEQFHAAGKQVVLVCLNLPYDAALYEDADAVLCAFQPYGNAHDEEGNGPFNMNVAVALCTLYNESVPSGTLPVNVPGITLNEGVVTYEDELLYERGAGLELWGD